MEKLKFDIQRFDTDAGAEVKKVALEVLNVFGQIVINLGLKKLAEELDKAQDATEWLKKNANPVLSFLGSTKFGKSFGNYAKLITNSIKIIDNTLSIVKDDLPDATRNSKIVSVAASLESMASATAKLSKDKDSAGVLSIVSGIISLTASLISGMDGITESEQEKINSSYISFMRTLGSDIVKKVFAEAFDEADDSINNLLKQGKFFTSAAPVFLKTFNGIMTFGGGILNGYNKYNNNLEKYLDDGIPEEIAKHDAFIDAIAKFAKETMSGIVFGVDDLIFDVAKWITSGLGIEYAEDENKDYIETLIYKTPLKKLNYTNTGLSTDDKILYVLENSTMVYGDDGNDAIDNFGFSNATIWGGHDNDTIHSYKTDSATPQQNSIFGGPGNDQIVVYDKLSTIYGGKDNDSIMVVGTNNAIYGNAGNDSIYVYIDANENAVSGGTGDDAIILLEGTKNALIKYNEGDGNDTIYYFDEDDALKISGSYKISTNDTDVKINVGNGSMLLVGAAGKNIKINGRTITNSDADDSTLPVEKITLPNVPTMPSIFESPFIYGTDGNDYIDNRKARVLVSSGAGDDSIRNSGDSVSIDAGAGNDSIYNNGRNSVKIDGGAGNDYIYNSGYSVTINGGEGNNFISNHGGSEKIEAGAGDDSIYSYYGGSEKIDAGAGNDYIHNSGYGDSVTIDSGAGDDSIENYSVNSGSINAGDGDDYIYSSYGHSVTINAGDGDDSIYNYYGKSVSINAGDGNDYIYNKEDSVTINAGDGDDSIDNGFSNSVSINVGDGDDYIYNSGYSVTIDGGTGNDSISLSSSARNTKIQYKNGDGNDTIYGFNGNDIIQVLGNNHSTSVSDNDIILKVGNGSMTLVDAVKMLVNVSMMSGENHRFKFGSSRDDDIPNFDDSLKIDVGEGNDSIYNYGSSVTIDAGVDNDLISNDGDSVSINGGLGDDSVFNYGSSLITINGGAGNDSIRNSGKTVTIDAGEDNDLISNDGDSVSINGGLGDDSIFNGVEVYHIGNSVTIGGGEGNDFISLSSAAENTKIKYTAGDGNDTVYGIKENDTLKIAGAKYSTLKSDDDLKIIVANGSILVKDKSSIDFTIDGTLGSGTDTTPADTLPAGISVKSSIVTASNKFTGNEIDLADYPNANKVDVAALSTGVSIVGSSAANSIKSGSGADTISGGYGNDTVSLGGGSDVYIYSSGNDLIQDYTSGQDKIKLSSGSISSVSISNNNVILNMSNGGKLTIQNGKDKEITFIDSNGKEFKQVYPIKEDTVPADTLPTGISISNSVITASSSFNGNKIDLADYKTATKVDASALSKGVSVVGSSAENSIKGGSGADTVSGNAGNDTVSLGGGSDVYIYSSGNDLIQDYTAGQDKIKLTSGSISSASVSNNNVILNISNGGIITIQNGKNKEITVIDSKGNETTQIYPANDTPEPTDTLPTGMSVKSSVLTASTQFKGNKIDLADYPTASKVNAAAVSQALTINGNSSANSIKGGKGADTISGGSGNDTLAGGTGKDVFVYSSGNDVVTDYKTGEDKIKIGSITNSTVKGSDIILTTSNGSLIVKATKDNVITFVDNNGKTSERIFFGNTSYAPLETGLAYDAKRVVLTASNKFTDSTIDLDEYLPTVTKLNASATSQSLNIVGNSSDNSIKAGKGTDTINGGSGKDTIFGSAGNDSIYGGNDNDKLQGDAGNDTLNGGKGNDTLTGNAGNDVFVYEGGNDLITDYKPNEDKIKLNLSAITKSSIKGSDVILTTSNGSLTVKATKDKAITFVDNNGKTSERIFFGNTSYAPLETGLAYDAKRVVLTASNKFTDSTIDLDEYLPTVTKVNASATSQSLKIVGNNSANSIKGGKGADTINGGNGKDTISSGTGNDSLYGGSDNDKLLGEAGNDTLNGGTGNDTLTGGAGNDVFMYEGGNDLITDYKPNEDKIRLNLSAITSSSVKGSDVILTTSNGTLTVKGTKDKVITFIDNNSKTSERIFFANTSYAPLETGLAYDAKRVVLTASNKFTDSTIDLDEYLPTVTKVNASATSQNVNIIGNSADNSIKAGKGADTINGGNGKDTIFGGTDNDSLYGGNDNDILNGEAGNDTLNGGRGNDTLTGGAGNDVFIYEGGNDVITDYTAGQDSIKVSGIISNVSYNGKNVVFSIGNGSLTVNNAKGKDITVTNNNNQTQTYSKTLDLLYDNNFVSDEFALDDISEVTESNYSVGKLEYSSNNNELANNSIISSSFDEK